MSEYFSGHPIENVDYHVRVLAINEGGPSAAGIASTSGTYSIVITKLIMNIAYICTYTYVHHMYVRMYVCI